MGWRGWSAQGTPRGMNQPSVRLILAWGVSLRDFDMERSAKPVGPAVSKSWSLTPCSRWLALCCFNEVDVLHELASRIGSLGTSGIEVVSQRTIARKLVKAAAKRRIV